MHVHHSICACIRVSIRKHSYTHTTLDMQQAQSSQIVTAQFSTLQKVNPGGLH